MNRVSIGFLGAGKMATALARGVIHSGVVAAGDVIASAGLETRDSGTWTNTSGNDLAFALLTASDLSGGTINNGSGSIVDSDAWGVVGFALIGTTAAGPPASLIYPPRPVRLSL